MKKKNDPTVNSQKILDLSQTIFERIVSHSSTFNENHKSNQVLEFSIDYAWSFLSLLDRSIDSYIGFLNEKEEFSLSSKELSEIKDVAANIFIGFVPLHFQGLKEGTQEEIVDESVSDAFLFVVAGKHTLISLAEEQDEFLTAKEKESKRLEKYGRLKLIKNDN